MLQWRMDVSAWELFNPKLQFQRLETFRWWRGWVFKDLPKGWSLEIPPFPRVLRLSSSWDMAQPFPPAARLFGCENVPHQNRGPLGTCSSKAMRLASTKTMRSWTFVGIKDARCFQDVPQDFDENIRSPRFFVPQNWQHLDRWIQPDQSNAFSSCQLPGNRCHHFGGWY